MTVQPHHISDVDYTCQRCRMFVRAHIPHECDPRVCRVCSGTKQVWAKGTGWNQCPKCEGTGLITFT